MRLQYTKIARFGRGAVGYGRRAGRLARLNRNAAAAPANSNGHDVTASSAEFFARALEERLTSADVFRITITSFLDAYNFDVRRLMKCCIHHVLPSGHVIPFCAYNVLYRQQDARFVPQTAPALVTLGKGRFAA